ARSTIMGSFEQQGTSMMTTVTLLMSAVLKISANFCIYASASSNLGHPSIITLSFRNSPWKSGYATGVQSAATRRSAPFRKGAVGGTSLIWTGQCDSAEVELIWSE